MAGCLPVMLLIGLLAGLMGPRIMYFLKVDRCLDNGGSFNAETQLCEKANSVRHEQKNVDKYAIANTHDLDTAINIIPFAGKNSL